MRRHSVTDMINYLSLFSGIGSPEKALENLGIPFNLVNYCEIDKYASKSFSAIHNVSEDLNLWDVTKINADTISERIDLITYGFPCQDISVAGKQRGFTDEEGNRTRSGLFFEALRIIQDYQPKFAIAENVKALTNKKFEKEFNTVLTSLEEAGYNNYWKVLNAKDYGIPQNRERVFIVSIRKDIDKGFDFPEPIELKLRLKDMLDKDVDEKYYLDDEKVSKIYCDLKNKDSLMIDVSQYKREGHPREYNEYAPTLNGRDYKDPRLINASLIENEAESYPINTMPDGTCRTLKSQYQKNSCANFALQTSRGETGVISVGNINQSGHVMNGKVVDENGLARTIVTEKGEGQKILTRSEVSVKAKVKVKKVRKTHGR